MKTLLLPKNLANEKGGRADVKSPMLSFSADPPPLGGVASWGGGGVMGE